VKFLRAARHQKARAIASSVRQKYFTSQAGSRHRALLPSPAADALMRWSELLFCANTDNRARLAVRRFLVTMADLLGG